VMRDGRPVTVEVTSDGAGLVSRAGTALVAQVADKVGLTNALSLLSKSRRRERSGANRRRRPSISRSEAPLSPRCAFAHIDPVVMIIIERIMNTAQTLRRSPSWLDT
jgi:hypothetical protein